MEISGINSSISFGYSHPLKTAYKKHKLPSVKYGFYGDTLSVDTVSLEHMRPKSKGGKSELRNYVLASKRMNEARGNADIRNFFNPEKAKQYLKQFVNVNLPELNGKKYIKMVLGTLKRLGIDSNFYYQH
jgi:hypothetical protein